MDEGIPNGATAAATGMSPFPRSNMGRRCFYVVKGGAKVMQNNLTSHRIMQTFNLDAAQNLDVCTMQTQNLNFSSFFYHPKTLFLCIGKIGKISMQCIMQTRFLDAAQNLDVCLMLTMAPTMIKKTQRYATQRYATQRSVHVREYHQ